MTHRVRFTGFIEVPDAVDIEKEYPKGSRIYAEVIGEVDGYRKKWPKRTRSGDLPELIWTAEATLTDESGIVKVEPPIEQPKLGEERNDDEGDG